jgi:hypothetical protein
MTRHGPALLALSIIAVAGWTYNVNYDTRTALDRLSVLRAEIAGQREALQVLRVEWAYLNAPDRLAGLVASHNEILGLMPLVPENLGIAAAIPYPPREAPEAAPAVPDALIAAADSLPAPQALAPATAAESETMTLAALSGPAATARSAAPARSAAAAGPAPAPAPMPASMPVSVQAPAAAAETVPVALEAAIAAALVEVGVTLDEPARPNLSRSGAVASPAGIVSVAASGAPVPDARPAPWSRP